jgi:hypothetical protein
MFLPAWDGEKGLLEFPSLIESSYRWLHDAGHIISIMFTAELDD